MHEAGAPVTGVCGHYGISRKTFYKWYGRYRDSDRDFHALKDRSRRPHSHPRSVPKLVVQRILALRRKTRYGPRRLAYYLAQEGIQISVYGVYRVLQREGIVKKRRSRPRKKPQSYAMALPGQRVQVDVKYLPTLCLKDRPEPLKQYLYNAIDDCTRLQVAWVSSEITPAASVQFLLRLLRRLPFPIQEVQTDHGSEFTYVFLPHVQKPHPFEEALKANRIRHKLIPVAKPQQNGKVERSHRTFDEECLNSRAFRKPQPREHAINRYLRFYNHHRPHSSLEWRTPLQRLQSFPEFRTVTHV
jgi:transposase InsO family protein|tara:strand:- start:48 stop:950 length:903 start_codon:yes stop_codon:yes gene_type:complete